MTESSVGHVSIRSSPWGPQNELPAPPARIPNTCPVLVVRRVSLSPRLGMAEKPHPRTRAPTTRPAARPPEEASNIPSMINQTLIYLSYLSLHRQTTGKRKESVHPSSPSPHTRQDNRHTDTDASGRHALLYSTTHPRPWRRPRRWSRPPPARTCTRPPSAPRPPAGSPPCSRR